MTIDHGLLRVYDLCVAIRAHVKLKGFDFDPSSDLDLLRAVSDLRLALVGIERPDIFPFVSYDGQLWIRADDHPPFAVTYNADVVVVGGVITKDRRGSMYGRLDPGEPGFFVPCYTHVDGAKGMNPCGEIAKERLYVHRGEVYAGPAHTPTVSQNLEKKSDAFPHSCPRCGGPAYVGLNDVDCQKGCR